MLYTYIGKCGSLFCNIFVVLNLLLAFDTVIGINPVNNIKFNYKIDGMKIN